MRGPTTLADTPLRISYSPISSKISAPVITSIYQDQSQALWIGTQTGLYRFIGKSSKFFSSSSNQNAGIPNADIRDIFETSNGELFIVTNGSGLLQWNKEDELFYTPDFYTKSRSQFLSKGFTDSKGQIWLYGNSGLTVFDAMTKEPIQWLSESEEIAELEGNLEFRSDGNSNVILTDGRSVLSVDTDSRVIQKIAVSLGTEKITSIFVRKTAELVIGTDSGNIYLLDKKTGRAEKRLQLSTTEKPSITGIFAFDSLFLFGTNKGLYVLNSELEVLGRYVSEKTALPHNHITVFSRVRSNVLVGTYQGLAHIGAENFQTFNNRNSGVYDDVMAFAEDSQRNVWVGTYAGLYRLNDNLGKHELFEVQGSIELPDSRVMTMETDKQFLWIGTWDKGIVLLDTRTLELETVQFADLQKGSITKIYKDHVDSIWVASYDRGLWRIRSGSIKHFPELVKYPITDITSEVGQPLLVVSERTIYKMDEETTRFKPLEIEFPKRIGTPTFFTAKIIGSHSILVGTKDHGILVLEKDEHSEEYNSSSFGGTQGITKASVYSIMKDSDGHYWSSTNNGLYKLGMNGAIVQRYDKTHGLQGDDFNFGAYYSTVDDIFYFGGTKGYTRFDPLSVEANMSAPAIVLSGLTITNSLNLNSYQLSTLDLINIPSTSEVSFEISVLDYSNPGENLFSHKLQGLDQDWIDDGTNNKITYNKIPPGEYTFLAKGANAAGVWNEEGVSLRIRVLPPWYLTYWAYAFYATSAMLLLWLGMRAHRTKVLKEEAERRAEETMLIADSVMDELQETQELQDQIAESASKHNMEMIGVIGELSTLGDSARRESVLDSHLSAMRLLETCYYFENGALAANMHDYLNGLIDLLLPDATVDPATISSINLVSKSLISARVALPLSLILYELIDNVFQHAFEPDSAANFVQVSLEIAPSSTDAPDTVEVSIQDDGIGLPVGFDIGTARSRGFSVVNSLCRRLSATVSVSQGHGTHIRLSVPLPHGHA